MNDIMCIVIIIVVGVLALLFGSKKSSIKKVNPALDKWYSKAQKWSLVAGVPVEIILAVIQRESAGNHKATAEAGELGLMQITPIFFLDMRRLKVIPDKYKFSDLADPDVNIEVGTKGLAYLIQQTGSIFEGLRAYNGAGTNFDRLTKNPNLAVGYANSVMTIAKRLGYNPENG